MANMRERIGEHVRAHGVVYAGLAAVVATVVAGQLQAASVLETGRRQVDGTLAATRAQIDRQRDSDQVHEQITRYGELIQASTRVRILMRRFERLDDKAKRDPLVIGELTKDTDQLAAQAASASVILQAHKSKVVRENAHGIAYTLPYAAQCLETGMPGNARGYQVDYPGLGLVKCAELSTWLEGHEKNLAQQPPEFS
ncbi:hypothetical protein [Streptomyces sp. NPDC000410]|uniref:hypothetical protein n=1 Tax=Streptomyces sp. NPDC000410 TaxID=3154254 RepID=UPI0033214DA3